ncbi:hypothetical protein DFP72DRAFT_859682 [Ephemerocybe angulata]|uniref:Uncharacterized protein n=1 Tax=Ephemerocybe angulata TaxID=980116 RepID=A0A8H6HB28_9AGAR|nr:hypothetical protein DFP72DRAFT_859682 [Tulosesus angulatus]
MYSEDYTSTDASRWLDAQVEGLPEPSAQWSTTSSTGPSGGQHQVQDPELLEMYEHVLRGDLSVFDAADISGFPNPSAQNASSAFGTDLPATFFDPNSTPYFNGIEPQLVYGGASIPNQRVPFSSNPEEWRMDERVPQDHWSIFNFDTGFATLPNPSSLHESGTQLIHPGHHTSNLGTVADGSASGSIFQGMDNHSIRPDIEMQAPLGQAPSETDTASKQGVSPDRLALDCKLLRADPKCLVISDTDTSVFCVYCNKFVELRDKRYSLTVARYW